MIVGISTQDVLSELRRENVFQPGKSQAFNDDLLARLSASVIEQRHFFLSSCTSTRKSAQTDCNPGEVPEPGSEDRLAVGASLDLGYLKLGEWLNVRPDILVLPTVLNPFAKEMNRLLFDGMMYIVLGQKLVPLLSDRWQSCCREQWSRAIHDAGIKETAEFVCHSIDLATVVSDAGGWTSVLPASSAGVVREVHILFIRVPIERNYSSQRAHLAHLFQRLPSISVTFNPRSINPPLILYPPQNLWYPPAADQMHYDPASHQPHPTENAYQNAYNGFQTYDMKDGEPCPPDRGHKRPAYAEVPFIDFDPDIGRWTNGLHVLGRDFKPKKYWARPVDGKTPWHFRSLDGWSHCQGPDVFVLNGDRRTLHRDLPHRAQWSRWGGPQWDVNHDSDPVGSGSYAGRKSPLQALVVGSQSQVV
ncbi:hypothetical protein MRB53_039992 [Persea americana]|nr:hypothetical protein MRB53_039992 [Persea americana]